ncbi:MAG: ABC transporter substrate-binding protein [Bradymonadaceae bacterium]
MYRRRPYRSLCRLAVLALLVAFLAPLGIGCQSKRAGRDSFTVLLDTKPKGLDPRFITSDASAKLAGILHAGLVNLDTQSGRPELELAKSIRQPTPTRYDITLREDIDFHDGHPVTAEDVEYTLTKLDEKPVSSPYANIARKIESFEIEDERHFTIELKHPHAPFRSKLSMGIVPKHRCAGHAECPGDPVGAGPFAYVGQDGNHRYVFEGFDDYFRGAPAIDRLVIKVVPNHNTRMLALLGKTAELAQNTVSPIMLPVVRETEGLEVKTASSFKYTYIGFNLEHPVLKERAVRRAIAYGIDRKSIVDYKFRGHAELASGLLAPDHWAYESDVRRYPYRPDRARQLLEEAGYARGDGPGNSRLEIEFKVSSDKFRRSIAELIAHQLARIGISVTVRSYEWGTFFHDIKSRNFAMTMLMWPSVNDPSLYRWIFHSDNIPTAESRSAGANRGAYRNPRLDELLVEGERVTDRQRRKAIYSKVQKILARDVPYVSLWHEDNIAVMKQSVEDYYQTPNGRYSGLTEAHVARPRRAEGSRE